MRYRDLPAIHFTPQPYAGLPMPEAASNVDISISPGGQVAWSTLFSDRTSRIFAEDGTPIALHPPDGGAFVFPLVQRFLDGRWLVVEARTDPITPNAFVFGSDHAFLRSFYLGDGIQTVLLDQNNKVWVGYFDEGVFGAFSPWPPEGHKSYRYGPSGLLRCDDRGEIEFSYNTQSQGKSISDIYALTLDDAGVAWFCPYTDFFLASASDDHVDYVLPRAPVSGANAISVGQDYVSFFGGYKKSSMIAVMHRASQRLRLIQLHKPDGDTLSPVRVTTRGPRAIAVADNHLFRLDHQILVEALGQWNDTNTTDVLSAVQYLKEEETYSDTYFIQPGVGAEKLAGKQRPDGNLPRKDEDTEK